MEQLEVVPVARRRVVILLAAHQMTVANYQRLGIPGLEALVGAGVFYRGGVTEARAMEGQHVFVVGAGNSAGQAAVHLAKYAAGVTMLVRGGSLHASMSDYLMKAIEASDNIKVRLNTRIIDGGGDQRLEALVLQESSSEVTETVPAVALFVLIGAQPHTTWLPTSILRDSGGFLLTGQNLQSEGRPPQGWLLERAPLLLETSLPAYLLPAMSAMAQLNESPWQWRRAGLRFSRSITISRNSIDSTGTKLPSSKIEVFKSDHLKSGKTSSKE